MYVLIRGLHSLYRRQQNNRYLKGYRHAWAFKDRKDNTTVSSEFNDERAQKSQYDEENPLERLGIAFTWKGEQ